MNFLTCKISGPWTDNLFGSLLNVLRKINYPNQTIIKKYSACSLLLRERKIIPLKKSLSFYEVFLSHQKNNGYQIQNDRWWDEDLPWRVKVHKHCVFVF